jgi:hypothetical protein
MHVPTWTRILGGAVSQFAVVISQVKESASVHNSLPRDTSVSHQCLEVERAATPARGIIGHRICGMICGLSRATHRGHDRGAPRRGHRGPVPATAPHVN